MIIYSRGAALRYQNAGVALFSVARKISYTARQFRTGINVKYLGKYWPSATKTTYRWIRYFTVYYYSSFHWKGSGTPEIDQSRSGCAATTTLQQKLCKLAYVRSKFRFCSQLSVRDNPWRRIIRARLAQPAVFFLLFLLFLVYRVSLCIRAQVRSF